MAPAKRRCSRALILTTCVLCIRCYGADGQTWRRSWVMPCERLVWKGASRSGILPQSCWRRVAPRGWCKACLRLRFSGTPVFTRKCLRSSGLERSTLQLFHRWWQSLGGQAEATLHRWRPRTRHTRSYCFVATRWGVLEMGGIESNLAFKVLGHGDSRHKMTGAETNTVRRGALHRS